MKVFFCSAEAGAGDLALRMGMEGHKVKLHVHLDKQEKDNFEGLLEKDDNWRKACKESDYVVLDYTKMPDVTSFIRKAGIPAFGMGYIDGKIGKQEIEGNELQTILEKDRKLAKELMRSLKIGETSESLEFSELSKAIGHLKQHKIAHVIKPEMTNVESQCTYVGEKEDGSDSIGWLETLPDRPDIGRIKKIEMEERIQGVEVGCAAWFNGMDFIGPPNINFEHKKIAAGDLGFNTGEMGTCMFYTDSDNKFFRETTYKMAATLDRFDYRGQLDINCIVNKDGIFPLEFTPRIGYPSIEIEQELHESSWGELFYAIAKGENYNLKVKRGWAIGAVLVGEGFPFWKEGYKRMRGLPVLGLQEDNIDHVHLYNILYKENRFLTNGCVPMIATANGKTVRESQDMLYKEIIPQFFFSSMYYRNDIGNHISSDLQKLKEWGYDFGMS